MRSDRGGASDSAVVDRGNRRYVALLLLPVGLLALRQAIVLLGSLLPVVEAQQTLTQARGIHPADLFYTQVPLALAAEKEVRRRVAGAGAGADMAEPTIIAGSSDREE